MINLSIIVPIYNTEKYLEKCLKSLCYQDVDVKNYEIIAVNDGSTDNSEKIVKKYQKKFPNLIKYIKKSNGGVSSARNIGIKMAEGEYILFIDSDDYVEKNMIKNFYKKNRDNDIFVFGYNEIIEGKSIKNNLKHSKIIPAKEAIPLFFEEKAVRGYTWNKILKRKIIVDNNLRFNEEVSYVEDLPFIIEYLTKIEKVYFSTDIWYNYIKREGSLINSNFNVKKLSALKSYEKIVEIIKNCNASYLPTIYYFMFELNYELSVRIEITNYNEFENEYKYLKKNMKKMFKKFIFKKVKIKYKIKATIKIIFYKLLIWKHGGRHAEN